MVEPYPISPTIPPTLLEPAPLCATMDRLVTLHFSTLLPLNLPAIGQNVYNCL